MAGQQLSLFVIAGNEAGVFEISSSTGNITMLKAVTMLDPVTLTVLVNIKTFMVYFSFIHMVLYQKMSGFFLSKAALKSTLSCCD